MTLRPPALAILPRLEPALPGLSADALAALLQPFLFPLACAGVCVALGAGLWTYVRYRRSRPLLVPLVWAGMGVSLTLGALAAPGGAVFRTANYLLFEPFIAWFPFLLYGSALQIFSGVVWLVAWSSGSRGRLRYPAIWTAAGLCILAGTVLVGTLVFVGMPIFW